MVSKRENFELLLDASPRMDTLDPTRKKFKTLTEEPTREIPRIDNVEPQDTKPRIETAAATWDL
jgi:hypothetical protein